jgi:hypothetical protein
MVKRSKILIPHLIKGYLGDWVCYNKPIVLSFEHNQNFGPTLFRFNPLWLQNPDPFDIISVAQSQHVSISPSFIWDSKIWAIKKVLKSWVKLAYVPLYQERENIHNKLGALQRDME